MVVITALGVDETIQEHIKEEGKRTDTGNLRDIIFKELNGRIRTHTCTKPKSTTQGEQQPIRNDNIQTWGKVSIFFFLRMAQPII